jgi:hypothetical protein
MQVAYFSEIFLATLDFYSKMEAADSSESLVQPTVYNTNMEVTGSAEFWTTNSALKVEVTGSCKALVPSYESTYIDTREVTISFSSVPKTSNIISSPR